MDRSTVSLRPPVLLLAVLAAAGFLLSMVIPVVAPEKTVMNGIPLLFVAGLWAQRSPSCCS